MVILENKAYLFDFKVEDRKYKEPTLTKKFITHDNSKGLGCLYSHHQRNVVILPGSTPTCLQIYDSKTGEEVVEYDIGEKPEIFAANIHGDIFAFAGETGQQIHIMNLLDGTKYKSYVRGNSKIEITSIVFDQFCFRMAVASKGDTVHVYSLPKELGLNGKSELEVKNSLMSLENDYKNNKSIPYTILESRINPTPAFYDFFSIKGEKSYLNVHIASPEKSLAILGRNLIILTQNGIVYSINIQEEGHYYRDSDEVKVFDLVKNEELEE